LFAYKFTSLLTSFSNLVSLSLTSVEDAHLIFKKLAATDQLTFAKTLRNLAINACILREDDGSGNTLTIWAGDEGAFNNMNTFIQRLEILESLELRGMSIVDHIGDLVQAVNRPKLQTLKLPLNGIEAEYCLYFNHLLNFETLLHLDLSSNWFGVPGLSRFKHTFKRFQ
jgi:hypothetical protein